MKTDTILNQLLETEQSHGVRILYACESGSRAWGFASPDSDYDVRFIYAHEPNWYLSIEERRDVIELPVNNVLDIGGWDIRKAFRLLRKCNCPLIEWLQSPIVYRQEEDAIAMLQALVSPAFLPQTACHHYLAMGKRKTDEILKSHRVKLKTYFYALRATLCAFYIVNYKSPPPMRYSDLGAEFLERHALNEKIKELLQIKQSSNEGDSIERVLELEEYLQQTQAVIENKVPKNEEKLALEVFDRAFRDTLNAAWQNT